MHIFTLKVADFHGHVHHDPHFWLKPFSFEPRHVLRALWQFSIFCVPGETKCHGSQEMERDPGTIRLGRGSFTDHDHQRVSEDPKFGWSSGVGPED